MTIGSVMRLKSYFAILRAYQVIIETLRNSNLRSKLGCSMNTLQNAKNELVKHGYLVIHRLSSANRYTLKIPTDYPKIKQSDYPKIKQSDYPKIGYHYKSNNNNNNNNNNNTNIKKFKGFKK
jgi:putative component of membrane protein insertase Oxa1/YidC/SpoIIIJ protein YidD